MVTINNTVLERVMNSVASGNVQGADYWRGVFATSMSRDTKLDDTAIYRVYGTLEDTVGNAPDDDDMTLAMAAAEAGDDIGFDEYVEIVPLDAEIKREDSAIAFGNAIAKSAEVNAVIAEQMEHAVKGKHNPVMILLALQRLHDAGMIDLDSAPRTGTTFVGDTAKSSVNKKQLSNHVTERYKIGERIGNWFEDVATRLPSTAVVFSNMRAIQLANTTASNKGSTVEVPDDLQPLYNRYASLSAVKRKSELGTWRSRKNAGTNAFKQSIELRFKLEEINEMKKLRASILRDDYDDEDKKYADDFPLAQRRVRRTTTPILIEYDSDKCRKVNSQGGEAECLSVSQVVRSNPKRADANGGSIADLRKSSVTVVRVTQPTSGLPKIEIGNAATLVSACYAVFNNLGEYKGKAKGKLLAYAETSLFSGADANMMVKVRDLLDEVISEGGLQGRSDAFQAELTRSANQLSPEQQAEITAKAATARIAENEKERLRLAAAKREADHVAEQALLDANKPTPKAKAMGGKKAA